ncbi:hypothetical protein ES705_30747 [subsurface metagenome]|jgi:ribosomal protein L37AE/L43A
MSDTITLEKRYCSACETFTWHTLAKDSSWQCIKCRSQALDDALEDTFIIIAQ